MVFEIAQQIWSVANTKKRLRDLEIARIRSESNCTVRQSRKTLSFLKYQEFAFKEYV